MVDILDGVAQNLMDRSLPKFQDWETGVRACSPHWAFLISRGTLPWQPIKVEKIRVLSEPIYFVALPFGNGLQYRKSDCKRLNRMNSRSTLCTILVAFGQETPEFMHLLQRYGKNRNIMQNISEYSGPILTYFRGLAGVLVRMIIQIFVWLSPKGCCYGNQLNLGDVSRHRVEWLYSLLRHCTKDWPIVNPLSKGSMAIIRLHRVQIWSTSIQ